jgi:DNA-binding NtrC family response regulator
MLGLIQEGVMPQIEFEERLGAIVGASECMHKLFRQVDEAGPSAASVLIVGETGTGKELVARALHQRSPRKSRAYVAVNCAAMPENLVESELFGHEKGAFTGASNRTAGYFEQANRGTLFLDEISAMPMSQQAKLLRALQEGTIRRLGSGIETPVDTRLIAAMNVAPEKAMEEGRLRTDLFYRLSVFTIEVPPLRERPGDALLLARHFASEFAKAQDRPPIRIDSEAARALASYPWPGNVRELRNAIQRGVILAKDGLLTLGELPAALSQRSETAEESEAPAAPSAPAVEVSIPGMTVEEVKRRLIVRTLEATGSISEAARKLGISSRTIYNKMREWNLSPESFSGGRV